jgi:hypothetical protein
MTLICGLIGRAALRRIKFPQEKGTGHIFKTFSGSVGPW